MRLSGEDYHSRADSQERFEGVLKITLLVFNVAKDNTRYTLSVSGQ